MFASKDNAESHDPSRQRPAPPNNLGDWQRSSFCSAATCVETLFNADRVSIRDGKQTDEYKSEELQPMLHVSPTGFSIFLDEVSGRAAVGANAELLFNEQDDGHVKLSLVDGPVQLTYNAAEWQAFRAGAAAGEFTVSD